MRIIKRIIIILGLVLISPVIWLWLLIDFPQLKRSALEIEPVADDNVLIHHNMFSRAFDWFLRQIVARILIVVFLPLIAIVGMFMWALKLGKDGG